MRTRLTLLLVAGLAACATGPPLPPAPWPPAASVPGGAGTAQPPPVAAPEHPPVPARPRMGPAASALLAQARAQESQGGLVAAGATLERALRIEPDNALLWVELGRLQLKEGNAAQADAMGRKALALAGGDAEAQAGAWSLIADSLRAQNRNTEAADADRHAAALAPH